MLGNIAQSAVRGATERRVMRSVLPTGGRGRHPTARGGGNNCCGALGVILGIVLLFWNEGRSVKQYKTIQEGLKNVVALDNINTVDPNNEDKLVHLTGTVNSDGPVQDEVFGITTTAPAIKLRRTSKMFQWMEEAYEQDVVTNSTQTSITRMTYSYRKGWSDSLISSDQFAEPAGHFNPSSLTFENKIITASTVNIGAFVVPKDFVNRISSYSALRQDLSVDNIPADSAASGAKLISGGNGFYFGSDQNSPEVGDTKVTFDYIANGETYSILAQQTGDSLTPYKAKTGQTLFEFQSGSINAEEMFEDLLAVNDFLNWLFRGLGFLLVYSGCQSILSPLVMIGSVIPCFGTCLRDSVVPFLSMVAATCIYGVVFAVAWLFYRPLWSIPLLLGAGAIIYLLYKFLHDRQNDQAILVSTEAEAEYAGIGVDEHDANDDGQRIVEDKPQYSDTPNGCDDDKNMVEMKGIASDVHSVL